MKRLFSARTFAAAALALGAVGVASAAHARSDVILTVGVGAPYGYVQPAPVYGLSLVNGVFCTILPVFMTMAAVQRIGAATASQAGMIGPVSTLFLGALILGEPITAVQLGGTGLVFAGIYLLSKKK